MNEPTQSPAAGSLKGVLTSKAVLSAIVHPRTIWPGVGKAFAHEDLPKHLFTVAALHARRALAAAHDQLDQLDRATSIGTSVELLAKAALALISPTLIADKDHKSLLLYSGIPAVAAHEAKSKMVNECLAILKHSHSINHNQQADMKVFSVRNLAVHMGQIDATIFDDALNIMTRLHEEILDVIKNYDSTLDRTTFWGVELLTQVDQRLLEERATARLELEELKAAARRAYERLELMGLDDGAFEQLADRDPKIDDEEVASAPDYDPERRACPVCSFAGWLGYEVAGKRYPYVDTDNYRHDELIFIDLEIQAKEFICQVCGLRLTPDLLHLVDMDHTREITVEATRQEIDAYEGYQIDSYLEDARERAAEAELYGEEPEE